MLTRRLIQLVFLAVWSVCLTAGAPRASANPRDQTYRAAADWQLGQLIDVAPAGDGTLQLRTGATDGRFEAPPRQLAPDELLVVSRRSEQPGRARLITIWRSGQSAARGDVRWGTWHPLPLAELANGVEQSIVPLVLPPGDDWLQVGMVFVAEGDQSPRLQQLTLHEPAPLSAGPLLAGLPQRSILNGPPTLTPRPLLIGRGDWDGPVQRLPPAQQPQTLRLLPLPWPAADLTAAFLQRTRGLQLQFPTARDLAVHYLIDPDGILLEGIAGGPGRAATPFAPTGEVLIGLGTRGSALTAAQQTTLSALTAWLCEAYPHTCDGAPDTTDDQTGLLQQLGLPTPLLTAAPLTQRVVSRAVFAEGTTADVGQRLSLSNPSADPLTATLHLRDAAGRPITQTVAVAARGHADVLLEALAPATPSLPLTVTANGPVAATRTMLVEGELESSSGLQPARRWYVAEAGTAQGRSSFLVLFNPQRGATDARLTAFGSQGLLLEQNLRLAAGERLSLALHTLQLPDGSLPLAGQSFSLVVSAARPIVAERMRRGDGAATALAGGAGTSRLARDWYFAEGTSQDGWRQQLILFNPQPLPGRVELILRDERGIAVRRQFSLAGQRRLIITPADYAPGGVAAELHADRAIVAERLFWRDDRPAASLTPGMTATGNQWLFAATRTRAAEVYLVLLNPGPRPAVVRLEPLGDAAATPVDLVVLPDSRRVTALHELWPERSGFGLLVSSDRPLVAEQTVLPGGIRGGMTVEQPLLLSSAAQ